MRGDMRVLLVQNSIEPTIIKKTKIAFVHAGGNLHSTICHFHNDEPSLGDGAILYNVCAKSVRPYLCIFYIHNFPNCDAIWKHAPQTH